MLIMAYSVDGGLQYGAGCITFIMVPFKVKVTSNMYVPLLCFRKVVWDV
jgi:hypothetical protein